MIEFIRIKRFKALLDVSFELSNLNLFAGLNGVGKSSVAQCLLLLRQSHERKLLQDKGLLLKGTYVSLGNGHDILAEQSESNSIEFTITWSDQVPAVFKFGYAPDSDLQPVESAPDGLPYDELSLFNKKFQHLAANRLEPRNHYDMSDFHINELNSLGSHGEYTVHFLEEYGQSSLKIPELRHPNAPSSTLLDSVDAWMAELSPGIRVRASAHRDLNSVSLSYSFVQGREVTADFRPQNVGFGVTFVLPVVTGLLRAERGDLIIVENPEAHLHPAGQSIIGRLCALAAANGIQVCVESHSDHFLNGVRVAVKNEDISANEVRLFFLERDAEGTTHSTTVQTPTITPNGGLDSWPNNFFDEWDRQLEQLL